MRHTIRIIPCVLLLCVCACAQYAPNNSEPFDQWLSEFRQEALSQGISQATLDDAFVQTVPLRQVIKQDRKQPESQLTLDEYLAKIVSPARIQQGRQMFAEHRALLEKVSAQYGVQPEIILALWGIETNYGAHSGSYRTIDALTTLAYDGRRSGFFRGELMNALQIIQAKNLPADALTGSWAGAMGQCQFMPSSYLKYAVDYDGDGRADIWFTEADVFASIANYLHSEGWNAQGTIEEGSTNFGVLLDWNRSRYFATAVARLASEIRA